MPGTAENCGAEPAVSPFTGSRSFLAHTCISSVFIWEAAHSRRTLAASTSSGSASTLPTQGSSMRQNLRCDRSCLRTGSIGAHSRAARSRCIPTPKHGPVSFPNTGRARSISAEIQLSERQEKLVRAAPHLLLRGLIHSDGCRFMNTGRNWRHPRYAFSLSADIRLIFMNACDELGLRWTTSGRTVYVSRMADVERMDRFIGPKP